MTHTSRVRTALLAVVALAGAGALWFVVGRPEPAVPPPPLEVEDLAPEVKSALDGVFPFAGADCEAISERVVRAFCTNG